MTDDTERPPSIAGPSHSVQLPPPDSPTRRPKQQLNCAECRRLKLKCDRQAPCSNCVRRGCRGICPDGVKEPRRSAVESRVTEQLNRRLALLENLLSDHGVSLPDQQQEEDSPSPHHHRAGDKRRHPPDSPSHYHPHPPRSRSPPFSARMAVSATRDFPRPSPPQPIPMQTQSPDRFWDRHSGYPPQPSYPHAHAHSGDIPLASPVEQSHGTLVIGSSGRSRYLGPTAGTEWLKNQELGETESPLSRSPRSAARELPATAPAPFETTDPRFSFPFASPPNTSTIESLLSQLPPKEDGTILVDCYYRYYAWLHDAAPRSSFQPLFDKLYADVSPSISSLHPQQLALVYVILAMGTLHNLELPPNDESAEDYLGLAKGCLMKGDFLNNNTIAGVRTLIIMGHYHLETEKGRNGDSAWPLWGLAMRIVVAMGLHRDGAKWNLPEDVVEERRQVFWECHTIEVFQANCFSRPSSLIPKYIDTAFPSTSAEDPAGSKTFSALTFQLCQISARILDVGMTVHHNPYSTVQELYAQLCTFERGVPFDLRCRIALMALPSVYPDPEVAKRDSPEVTRRHLHRTLQQYTIALNISEQILHLQRPYFVMAMHDQPVDPTRSIYGHSYLAVVERCNVIIQVVASLYEVFPAISSRHWFFWYHLFTAAVCLGTLILKNPSSVLANFALGQIDQAIGVYSALIKQVNSPSMIENHDWLVRLRHRAAKKVSQSAEMQSGTAGAGVGGGAGAASVNGSVNGDGEGEDVELLGWRTRLIERGATGAQTAINISPTIASASASASASTGRPFSYPTLTPPSVISSSIPTGPVPSLQQQVMQQHLVWDGDGAAMNGDGNSNIMGQVDSSTDMLLHQFWDPMMMPDSARLATENWWSWDLGLDQAQPQQAPNDRPV